MQTHIRSWSPAPKVSKGLLPMVREGLPGRTKPTRRVCFSSFQVDWRTSPPATLVPLGESDLVILGVSRDADGPHYTVRRKRLSGSVTCNQLPSGYQDKDGTITVIESTPALLPRW